MTPLPRFDPDWALFFDFDGTLAEIADTPGRVQVEARLGPSLRRMFEALDGAVAIISGRPIAEIDAFLDPLVLPVAGLHGLERRTAAGSIVRAAAANGLLDEARLRLAAIAAANPGVWRTSRSLWWFTTGPRRMPPRPVARPPRRRYVTPAANFTFLTERWCSRSSPPALIRARQSRRT